jgi:hypothetical protein
MWRYTDLRELLKLLQNGNFTEPCLRQLPCRVNSIRGFRMNHLVAVIADTHRHLISDPIQLASELVAAPGTHTPACLHQRFCHASAGCKSDAGAVLGRSAWM